MNANKPFIRSVQKVTCAICGPVFSMFLHLKIEGLENINGISEPYIISPNHVSGLDPLIAMVVFNKVLRRKPAFCATKGFKGWLRLFYNDFFFNPLGGYKVYYGTGDYRKALVNHIDFLRDGHSVCIFPEGKISRDGRLGEAKGGASFLAHEFGIPIIPVAISGLWGLTLKDFFLRRRNVTVTVCEPVEAGSPGTKGRREDIDFREHSQLVMKKIEKHL